MEILVHVDDGSNYGNKPHPTDVKYVESGLKMYDGTHYNATDKGYLFEFKSHDDAKNFANYVYNAPYKSVDASIVDAWHVYR